MTNNGDDNSMEKLIEQLDKIISDKRKENESLKNFVDAMEKKNQPNRNKKKK